MRMISVSDQCELRCGSDGLNSWWRGSIVVNFFMRLVKRMEIFTGAPLPMTPTVHAVPTPSLSSFKQLNSRIHNFI